MAMHAPAAATGTDQTERSVSEELARAARATTGRRLGAVTLNLRRRVGLDLVLALHAPDDKTAPEPSPPHRASSGGRRRFHRAGVITMYARPGRLDIAVCLSEAERARHGRNEALRSRLQALDEYLTAILNASETAKSTWCVLGQLLPMP